MVLREHLTSNPSMVNQIILGEALGDWNSGSLSRLKLCLTIGGHHCSRLKPVLLTKPNPRLGLIIYGINELPLVQFSIVLVVIPTLGLMYWR